MNTKETLRKRKDIPDEYVEELVARAAQLQDASQQVPKTASLSEIEAVATELDIAPEFVEAAIQEWRGTQDSAPQRMARDRIKGRGKAILKGVLILTGLAAIGAPLLGWAIWSTLGPTVFLAVVGAIAAAIAGIIWLIS